MSTPAKKKKFPIWIVVVGAVALLGIFVTIRINTYLKEKKNNKVQTAVVEPEINSDETRKGYKNAGNENVIDIFNKQRVDSVKKEPEPKKEAQPEKKGIKTPAKPAPEKKPAANALSSTLEKQEKPVIKIAAPKPKLEYTEEVKFNFTVVKEDEKVSEVVEVSESKNKKTEEIDLSSFTQGKIYGNHVLKHNEPVNLRTTEKIMLARNKFLPEGALLYGVCNLSQNRMKIRITRAMTPQGNYPVDISVYDSYDFQEGIFIQGRHIDVQPEEGIGDVAEEVSNVLPNQLIGTSVKTASKLMQRDVKTMKKASIKVADSYVVYFRVNNTKSR